jgi:hypothetical protein
MNRNGSMFKVCAWGILSFEGSLRGRKILHCRSGQALNLELLNFEHHER